CWSFVQLLYVGRNWRGIDVFFGSFVRRDWGRGMPPPCTSRHVGYHDCLCNPDQDALAARVDCCEPNGRLRFDHGRTCDQVRRTESWATLLAHTTDVRLLKRNPSCFAP